MTEHDEDPIDRLRAADPAAGIEPRSRFADEVVAAAASAPTSAADLGAERARRLPGRRPGRLLATSAIAASIAAALVVGGVAGFGLARGGETTAGPISNGRFADDGMSGGAAPPISLGDEGGATSDQAESGAATDATSRAADSSYPYGFASRSSFRASVPLSTSAGRAAAYAFDASAASTPEEVAALAAAFGVEGAPEIRDGTWTVGPGDGSPPSLGVSLDGTLSFWYGSGEDPWACEESCVPAEEAPAVAAARDLLAGIGRDPDAYEYTSEAWEGSTARSVSAWPVVDGQRIDQPWSITYADGGIVDAFGALAGLVPFGEYDIVSEQEAMARLSDPRFGARLTNLPVALREGVTGEEWTPPTAAPALPAPGTALSWAVNDVEIVSVRLGLAGHPQPSGAMILAPTYEFTDAGGGTWSVIAASESALDFSAADATPYGWIE